MSFALELYADVSDWERAERVAGGDPLDGERDVTAHELADLIEQSRLDGRTLYRAR